MSKPNCRYGCFDGLCPQKPYFVEINGIIEKQEDGCQNYIIRQERTENGNIRHIGLCSDLWAEKHMLEWARFAFGNQLATEQIRNAMCDEVEKRDNNNKAYKVYEQKTSHELKQLCAIISQNQEIINGVMKNIESKINQLEQKDKFLIEDK